MYMLFQLTDQLMENLAPFTFQAVKHDWYLHKKNTKFKARSLVAFSSGWSAWYKLWPSNIGSEKTPEAIMQNKLGCTAPQPQAGQVATWSDQVRLKSWST